ncbi:MAG: metal ABC transporter permease [Candidatus Altiarchaeota archaeon]|nr:metal ABC transporter permease [Candidatus Altiarchaeota archaeon]
MVQESSFMNINMIEMESIILTLVMGAFIGGAAGYIGSLMVTKRMALMGGALGHLTLPGIALALMYDFDVSLGALLFLAAGIILIWLFELRTRLPMEALTAVVFASSVAVAFLFLPEEKTAQALIGDISQISPTTTLITVVLALIVFFVTRHIFSEMILASISEDVANAEGVNVKKYNLIYLACIALTVALGVRIVGGLLTAALVAIPACTSRNLSRNLFQYSYGAMILGSLACILGILGFKFFTDIPAGPLIIIASAVFFLISLIFKRY